MKLKTLSAVLGNIRMHRLGKCIVCGRSTVFVCTDPSSLRNSMECFFCRSSSRNRHVAQVILTELAREVGALADLHRKSLAIYNADCGGALSSVLAGMPTYTCSGFFPEITPGTMVEPGVYCQDLERLSFQDASFDVVITEDVLEHVRHYQTALEEIHRVLKPGGCHIFTVPFFFDRPTLVRVDTTGETDVNLLPPEYHGDSIRGRILAYRTLGFDLFGLLTSIGFETRVRVSCFADQKLGIFDSSVFFSRKVG